MGKRGVLQGGERLHPTTDATTVRVRDGETVTSDGPFAETKEQMGGYFVIDAKDLDDAIEIAAKIPGARFGSIEVRPIWECDPRRRGRGRQRGGARGGRRRRGPFSEEWGRVVATLIRVTGDSDVAEERA